MCVARWSQHGLQLALQSPQPGVQPVRGQLRAAATVHRAHQATTLRKPISHSVCDVSGAISKHSLKSESVHPQRNRREIRDCETVEVEQQIAGKILTRETQLIYGGSKTRLQTVVDSGLGFTGSLPS